MDIVLEYLAYVFVAVVLSALLFAASALVVLSREGAKQIAPASRKIANRTIHLVADAAKSAEALRTLASRVDS
ncbi:MAG: hypothetical protein DMG26_19315 [Acidobacteria bacterium]|nr:MAG: hypothetical protein DMG26_19315 [Acidobacteriota bacterium]